MPQYAFEDIIINSNERRAGQPGDEKNFIAMSHFIPHDLTIHEWGVREPFTDEKLVVKKGDVLFIWQDPANHRVAISPIDGLFTAFGYVFRPKTEVILPGFLPYFITSDTFVNKVSSMAVGTKSKRANWKELTKTMFEIPSLEMQQKLLEIIDEFEAASSSYDRIANDLASAKKSYFYEHIVCSPSSRQMSLGELMFLQTQSERVETLEHEHYTTYEQIARNTTVRTPKVNSKVYLYRLRTDQMIAHRTNFSAGSFALVPEKYNNYLVSTQVQLFNINQNLILPGFLYYMISQPGFLASLESMDLSTENWNYTFSKHKISVPSKAEQLKFLEFSERTERSLSAAMRCKAQAYESLQSLLCEHIREA